MPYNLVCDIKIIIEIIILKLFSKKKLVFVILFVQVLGL